MSEGTVSDAEPNEHRVDPPSFRWSNFRGFEDTDWFHARRLTLVIGPNNSGKSSLLAPLLALKQTVQQNDPKTRLSTRGPWVNLGGYGDYVHNRDTTKTISLAIRYHHHKDSPGEALDKPIDKFPPGAVALEFDVDQDGSSANLLQMEIFDPVGRLYLRRRRESDGRYSLEAFDLQTRNESEERAKDRILADKPIGHMFAFAPLLIRTNELANENEDEAPESDGQSSEFRDRVELYGQVVETARWSLWGMLSDMAYIGPMRDRPRRFYEHLGSLPRTVGSRGEHAAEILYRLRNTPLKGQVDAWVERMGLGKRIQTQELGGGVFAIELELDGIGANIADCGFGVGCGSIATALDGSNLDHLTSLSRGRSRGSGLGTSPSA